ncbi:uncharacterized protein [Triticum aestivum]|uniref:uncharacterized protein n=1 Tax=Triticum aestivum TaxID=4565 RepID=UPI001D0268F9|nr:uncharacterized protein LOC123153385 [Triticum aestivum]
MAHRRALEGGLLDLGGNETAPPPAHRAVARLFLNTLTYASAACLLRHTGLLPSDKAGLSSVVNVAQQKNGALVACSGVMQPSWANDHVVCEGKLCLDGSSELL